MQPASRVTAAVESRTMLFVVGAVMVAASCGLGAVIFIRREPFGVDTWWNLLFVQDAAPFLVAFSRVMDFAGGGWMGALVIPVVGAVALILMKRPWSAAFFITAELAAAGAVQALKHGFGRARPEEIIVLSDFGSFPSGHVANAATLATVAFVLFPRIWVAMVGLAWVLLMALSRTVLHAHWLSDTVGGALIGAGVVLIVAGIYAPLLRRERPDRPARASDDESAPQGAPAAQ